DDAAFQGHCLGSRAWRRGCGRWRWCRWAGRASRLATQEGGDITEGVKGAELLGLDSGSVGEAVLECGEDLDALDRVDAEIGVQRHVELQHLRGISCLFRDHVEQHALDAGGGALRLRRRR